MHKGNIEFIAVIIHLLLYGYMLIINITNLFRDVWFWVRNGPQESTRRGVIKLRALWPKNGDADEKIVSVTFLPFFSFWRNKPHNITLFQLCYIFYLIQARKNLCPWRFFYGQVCGYFLDAPGKCGPVTFFELLRHQLSSVWPEWPIRSWVWVWERLIYSYIPVIWYFSLEMFANMFDPHTRLLL